MMSPGLGPRQGDSGGSSGGSNRRSVRPGPSSQTPRCQVEGCGIDLTNTKSYYSKHKVCGMHSKTSKVIVSGLEQRFCQQCSRFHQLSEFDLEKRSCRKRLANHNERRRKPQPASLSVLPSSYGRITPSLFGSVVNGSFLGSQESANGSFLGNQEMGCTSARTLDSRVMRQLESYNEIGDSNCALSLLSNPYQRQEDNNHNRNNTWMSSSSGFSHMMTVTMAQPPPAPSHNVLSLGEFELSEQDHQSRRQNMEGEKKRAYDSSSHHTNWSL